MIGKNKKQIAKEIIVALSLSNLCLTQAWCELSGSCRYFLKTEPGIAALAAAIGLFLAFGAAFYGTSLLLRRLGRGGKTVCDIALISFLALGANGVRRQLAGPKLTSAVTPFGDSRVAIFLLLAGLAFSALLVLVFHRQLSQGAFVVLLCLSPYAAFTVGGSAIELLRSTKPIRVEASATATQPVSAKRLVFLLFDELDERQLFERRPPNTDLSEFDRLRGQALHASRMISEWGFTLYAIPTVTTGQKVVSAKPTGDGSLQLTFENGVQAEWGSTPYSLFAEASSRGLASGISGWYHPYCRLFGPQLKSCSWFPREPTDTSGSLTYYLKRDVLGVVYTVPLLSGVVARMIGSEVPSSVHYDHYRSIHADAIKLASDRAYDFVYIHYPIPHPPGMYDRSRHEVSIREPHTYLDNLELANRTLRELREAMVAGGTWDDSTVVVTSDHWWRTAIYRGRPEWTEEEAKAYDNVDSNSVPLLVKLPHQQSAIPYDKPLSHLVLHDLVIEYWQGNFSEPQELSRWLDLHQMK